MLFCRHLRKNTDMMFAYAIHLLLYLLKGGWSNITPVEWRKAEQRRYNDCWWWKWKTWRRSCDHVFQSAQYSKKWRRMSQIFCCIWCWCASGTIFCIIAAFTCTLIMTTKALLSPSEDHFNSIRGNAIRYWCVDAHEVLQKCVALLSWIVWSNGKASRLNV